MSVVKSTETDLLRLICDEARVLGVKHGRKRLAVLQLKAEDFEEGTHRVLFLAIERVLAEGRVPDAAQLSRAAPQLNGQVEKFCAHSPSIVSPEQAEDLADYLRDASRRRALRAVLQGVTKALDSGAGVSELITRLQQETKTLPSAGSTWLEANESVDRLGQHLEEIQAGSRAEFTPTGIRLLDEKIGGFWAELNVICARGSVGKSAMWATVARNLARRGIHSLSFLPEDGLKGLRIRHLALEAAASMRELLTRGWNDWTRGRVEEAKARIAGWPGQVLIDETPSLSGPELLHRARVAIATRGVGVVAVDNMTAMSWPRGERSDLDRQDFCQQAANLAHETGVPFILLSHVKASVSEDRVPMLEDCSESAGMSKIARVGLGLARGKGDGSMEVGVSKGNFSGPTGEKFELQFHGEAGMLVS